MIAEVTYRTEAGEILAAKAPGDWRPEANGWPTDLADVQVIRTAGGLELLLAYVGGSVRGVSADPDWINTVKNTVLDYIQTSTEPNVPVLLRGAMQASNQEVVTNPELHGTGLTQVILAIQGTRLYLAQVGNSRAYLVRDNQLRQMTRDHTLASELLRFGKTLPTEISESSKKNELVRFIGKDRNIYVDTRINLPEVNGKPYLDLKPGDGVILCNNGLIERVMSDDQENSLDGNFFDFYQQQNPSAVARKLVEAAGPAESAAGRSAVVIKSGGEAIPQPLAVAGSSCLGQIGVIATVLIVSVLLGLIAAYAFPALMNPKPIPNSGVDPVRPGFIAVSQADGQVQAIEPGKDPVDLRSGALLEAKPGMMIMTASGTTKVGLADGSSVYIDRATLVTLASLANLKAGQMETILEITGGAMMVDTSHNTPGVTTLVTNAEGGNAVATGAFIGVQYNPEQDTMIVDCLRGPCQISGAETSLDMITGQRASIVKGVISPISEADYNRWLALCDSACPTQQQVAPVVTPTFVPTPTPYLGAFKWDDVFNLTSLSRPGAGNRTGSQPADVTAAGMVPWAFLLLGGYQIAKAVLKGYQTARSRKK